MRAGRSLVLSIVVLVALSAFAATWEGTAVVGVASDFPDNGLTAACNSFPKDSTIELRNLENGKLVRVVISGGLDNPGVFIILSPLAASELGMKPGATSRIRATVVPVSSLPSPDTATASRSLDPDFNPALLATADAGTQATTPADAGTQATTPAAAPASTAGSVVPAVIPATGQAPSDASQPSPTDAGAAASPGPAPAADATAPTEAGQTSAPGTDMASGATTSASGATTSASGATTPAGPDTATVIGGDTPVPISGAAPPPPANLPQASEPSLPPSETGTVLGGDQPTAPPAPVPSGNLADATPATPPAPLAGAPETAASNATAANAAGGPAPATAAPATAAPETAATATTPPAETSPATALPATAPPPPEAAAAPAPSGGGSEQVLSLEPASARPPPQPASQPETGASTTAPSTPEATPSTSPAAPASAAPAAASGTAAPAPLASRHPIPIETLEKGSYYLQVGVFGSDQGLVDAASRLDLSWPIASEKIAGPKGDQYRLLVGPVLRDDSGLYIIRLKSLGYRDAFVRKGQ
ncbi:MAG: hypothetical protein M0001_10585 [Treponema sp.]|nr:hypothetical protein [Treponema sp.]